MVLSNAERQKRWRQRQLERNRENYLKGERARKMATYAPHCELSGEMLQQRRQDNRDRLRKYYNRKKAAKKACVNEPCASTSTRSKAKTQEALIVKLPITGRSKGVQKTYRRALSAAYRRINEMQLKCKRLEKEKRTLQRRSQREAQLYNPDESSFADMSSSSLDSSDCTTPNRDMTPKSKTKFLLRKAGVTFSRKNTVHRELFLGNVVIASVKKSISQKKRLKTSTTLMSAEILKKYRCINSLSKAAGVNRKKMTNLHVRRPSASLKRKYAESVRVFLEREDNSVIQPGKRDTKTVEKDVRQKYVLSDYMHNLWEKFCLENPETKMSKSQFCKLRPSHILLTSFASRRTCLCTYHQNFSLKIKTLRRLGIKCSANTDVFLTEYEATDQLKSVLESGINDAESITFKIWKKIQDEEKYRWKEIEEKMTKGLFISTVVNEYSTFREHVLRVKTQYGEMRRLRQSLPDNEIVLWVDFSENYVCTALEEVQSAYWNTEIVSLHTMVVYLSPNCEKKTQCYVAAPESLKHNAAAVYCSLQKCIPLIKNDVPDLRRIHYLSDSPTSQYRNKTIYQILCNHTEEFGVDARWNYLETGHGKGPCDGLGASVKRAADQCVKHGKAAIQDAEGFIKRAESTSDISKVKYFAYTDDEVMKALEEINRKEKPMPIAGTMKLHAAVPISTEKIATRETSCNCGQCLSDVQTTSCSGWTIHNLYKSVKKERLKMLMMRHWFLRRIA